MMQFMWVYDEGYIDNDAISMSEIYGSHAGMIGLCGCIPRHLLIETHGDVVNATLCALRPKIDRVYCK